MKFEIIATDSSGSNCWCQNFLPLLSVHLNRALCFFFKKYERLPALPSASFYPMPAYQGLPITAYLTSIRAEIRIFYFIYVHRYERNWWTLNVNFLQMHVPFMKKFCDIHFWNYRRFQKLCKLWLFSVKSWKAAIFWFLSSTGVLKFCCDLSHIFKNIAPFSIQESKYPLP